MKYKNRRGILPIILLLVVFMILFKCYLAFKVVDMMEDKFRQDNGLPNKPDVVEQSVTDIKQWIQREFEED